MRHSSRFPAGEREVQPSEEPRVPGSKPHLLTWPPALCSTTWPQGPKVCSSHLGLHCLFCWLKRVTDAHMHSSMSVMLSGANANFPHCTVILRIIPFKTLYFTHVQVYGFDHSETHSYNLHGRLKIYI